MRRNFAQILANSSVDISKEYDKLFDALFCCQYQGFDDTCSMYELFNNQFSRLSFRDTCLSLGEFDQKFGFEFPDAIGADDIDTLVSFCEYFYNLLVEYNPQFNPRSLLGISVDSYLYRTQIDRVMENIGYMRSKMNGLIIYVERSAQAIGVAESNLIPEDLSYTVISYNHHSMKGNLQEKKNTLIQLADLLEPKRKDLDKVDKEFSSDLFFLFNNLNLRHNNIDPNGKSYKKVVAEMASDQLEKWYDETYQMCLLAFMQLEHTERKKELDTLKNQI